MTDDECFKIEMLAVSYLIRCGFDDLTIATFETSKALKGLQGVGDEWLKNDIN